MRYFKDRLEKIFLILRKYGLRFLVSKILLIIIKKVGLLSELDLIKNKLIIDYSGGLYNEIKYGIFKGVKMHRNVWWGRYDVISKMFGSYEDHLLSFLKEYSHGYKVFIDIGAADGYYSTGLVFSGIFDEAVCFEVSSKGREVINLNSRLNNVHEKVQVLAEANYISLKKLMSEIGAGVLLVDIEGGEFDLLDIPVLELLKDSALIVELHDFYLQDGITLKRDLISRCEVYFHVKFIKRHETSVYNFAELDCLTDDERGLVFSEGRPRAMEWLVLTPK